jgi:hypothetical protein
MRLSGLRFGPSSALAFESCRGPFVRSARCWTSCCEDHLPNLDDTRTALLPFSGLPHDFAGILVVAQPNELRMP